MLLLINIKNKMNLFNYECPKCHKIFSKSNKVLHNIHCTMNNPLLLNQNRALFLEENNNQNNQNNNSNQNNINNYNKHNLRYNNYLNQNNQININNQNQNNLNYNNINNRNNRIQNNLNYNNQNNLNNHNQNNINNQHLNRHNRDIPDRPQPNLGLRNEPISHRDIFHNIRESLVEIPQTFDCWLCGQTLPESEKIDHILCHQIQDENEEGNPRNEQNNLNQNQRLERRQRRDPSAVNHQRLRGQSPINLQIQRDPSPFNRQNNNQRIQLNHQITQPNNNQMAISNNNFHRRIDNRNQQNNNRNRHNLVVDIPSFRNEDIFHNRLIQHRLIRNIQPNENNRPHVNIANLPVTKIDNISSLDPEKKICTICLCDYIIGDNVIILPCIHMYHSECIKEWLKNKDFCPLCKIKIEDAI